jgi:hypothetical protein
VRPVKAASTVRVSGWVRYSIGFLALAGAGRAFCLAEREEGDVFAGAVPQERFDGAQPQRDGPRRVVSLVAHPGQPAFEVVPVEVVEAHLSAFDVLVIGQVVEEAF